MAVSGIRIGEKEWKKSIWSHFASGFAYHPGIISGRLVVVGRNARCTRNQQRQDDNGDNF